MTMLCRTVEELRALVAAWRQRGQRIALVPTMGALHAGHLALMEAAREVDRVLVTIFVNPTQFAPGEDFTAYPRDLGADRIKIEATGVDVIYAPDVSTMYPTGFATSIEIEGPAKAGLEDRFRPTHFAGVATIVAKLLIQAQPDVAVFGEKDFQQLKVIERLVADLDIPVAVRSIPIVREPDGLALSSRNAYLSTAERRRAPTLYAALIGCAEAIDQGARIETAIAAARKRLEGAEFGIDYLEVRHAASLAPVDHENAGPTRILAAARLGRTRLIDNVGLEPHDALPKGGKATG